MESSQNHQIKLVDASMDEVKTALMTSPSANVDLTYLFHIGKRKFEQVTKGLKLPLTHYDALEAYVNEQVDRLKKAQERLIRSVGEVA